MIIETTANQLYSVTESTNPDYAHIYYGRQVKRSGNDFILTARAKRSGKVELVRKLGCRIVHPNIIVGE